MEDDGGARGMVGGEGDGADSVRGEGGEIVHEVVGHLVTVGFGFVVEVGSVDAVCSEVEVV